MQLAQKHYRKLLMKIICNVYFQGKAAREQQPPAQERVPTVKLMAHPTPGVSAHWKAQIHSLIRPGVLLSGYSILMRGCQYFLNCVGLVCPPETPKRCWLPDGKIQPSLHCRYFRHEVWIGKLYLPQPHKEKNFFSLEIRSSMRWTSHDFLAVRGMFFAELYSSHIDYASHEITTTFNMKLARFHYQFSHFHLCRRVSQCLVIGQLNDRRNSMSINAMWCI